MKVFIGLTVLLFSHFLLTAQKEPKIVGYFDAAWLAVTDQQQAVYYRTAEKLGGGKFLVTDYYMSGKLQMKPVVATGYYPRILFEAVTTLYHENGQTKEEGLFKDETRVGRHTFWYDNGALHKVVMYNVKDKQMKIVQFKSKEGQDLLTAGGDAIIKDVGEGSAAGGDYYIQLADSIQISSFILGPTPSDTLYLSVEKEPEYAGGLETMYKKINQNLKYPATARRKNIEGVVYLSFIVDEQGNAIDHQIVRGIFKDCDDAALAVTKQLTDWTAGMNRGKLVKVKFILPIVFDLR